MKYAECCLLLLSYLIILFLSHHENDQSQNLKHHSSVHYLGRFVVSGFPV